MITKKRQRLYEKIYQNNSLSNNIPEICGYYGRACRNMNKAANLMLCNECTFAVFASVIEAIIETCNEKEDIGIEYLYDSDIFDIQEKMRQICVDVEFSYIKDVLCGLVSQNMD